MSNATAVIATPTTDTTPPPTTVKIMMTFMVTWETLSADGRITRKWKHIKEMGRKIWQ